MFFGPIVNTARGISTQVNGAINGFVGNFQVAVNPRIIQTYAEKAFPTFYKLIQQSAKTSFFLLLILVVPVWVYINEILTLWLGVVPEHTAEFCRVVFISSLINTFSLPLATAANANGQIKVFQIGCGIFELMNIPVSYILLKIGYPPIAVYYVALTIVLATLFVRLGVLRRLIKLDVKKFLVHICLRCLVVAAVAFGGTIVMDQIFPPSGIACLVVEVILSIVFTGLLIATIGLNKAELFNIWNTITIKFKAK